jgi:hypothetical protein
MIEIHFGANKWKFGMVVARKYFTESSVDCFKK